MVQAGVGIFGGCCGTTDEYIAALVRTLKDKSIVPPAPKNADMLPASTEKIPVLLPVDAPHGAVLQAKSDMEDALAEAMEEQEPVAAIKIGSWEDVDALADWQYAISKPLCLVCDEAELLEAALRVYQGRALYEGGLSEEALLPLCDRYGLLI